MATYKLILEPRIKLQSLKPAIIYDGPDFSKSFKEILEEIPRIEVNPYPKVCEIEVFKGALTLDLKRLNSRLERIVFEIDLLGKREYVIAFT